MKLVLLIASAMTAVMMAIHILDERYKRKRIAKIEENLKGQDIASVADMIHMIEEKMK